MYKYFFLLLLAVLFFGCSQDEIPLAVEVEDVDLFSSPYESMTEDLAENYPVGKGTTLTKSAGESAADPIVVSADAFVWYVDYFRPVCTFTSQQEFGLERFGGLFLGGAPAGVSPGRTQYDLTSSDCFLLRNTPTSNFAEEFVFGTYYEIFGETVRLSRPLSMSGFWFRDVPGSSQVEPVSFSEDGGVVIGAPIAFPYDEDADCSGVPAFDDGRRYQPGERYVLDGQFLYEFNIGNVVFLGVCGDDTGTADPEPDICAGVAPWESGRRYRRGSLVTYQGFLYERVRRGWRRLGACG